MRLRKIILTLLCADVAARAQTAPAVTAIQAIQHEGQTFITWNDAATGTTGSNYRYDLYRSTSGPITTLGSATLVETVIYNNSAQLIGPKPYNQSIRQNTLYPMSKIQNGGTALPLWSGATVYTNLATASAYYAVITHDITGSSADSVIVPGSNATTTPVSESVAPIQPILQIPGTNPSRMIGCSNCMVTSASIGQPIWLKLHASGGMAAAWGDYWAYWGDSTMGFQDGTQAMYAVYQDVTGDAFDSGFENQLIVTPQDAVWSVGAGGNSSFANAQSETYWYGYNASASVPGVSQLVKDSGAYIFPSTKNKLNLLMPWTIAYYQPDPNRVFAHGISMGGYGVSTWALRQANLFAGAFMGIPIIGPWQKIPQVDFGAALGTVAVINGSTTVNWVSGQNFGIYLNGPNTPFNLTINGKTKVVSVVNSPTQLTLTNNWTDTSGDYNYVTGNGNGCNGAPACGAGLSTIATSAVNLLPDQVTQYNNDTDTPTWVSQNCGRNIPYVAWAAGRLDTTTAGMWNMSVLFANALETCHLGFSFAWANDYHNTDTSALVEPLTANYASQLHLNVSYPAFTSFSLDSNYGNGNTNNGDCITGNASQGPICYINFGWAWTTPLDTAASWSTTVTNSQLTTGTCPTTNCATTATVSITPRNAQSFIVAPGTTVYWSASNGQGGSVVADTYGLATVSGVNLTTSALTITLSTSRL
jgi:hypothetical protein